MAGELGNHGYGSRTAIGHRHNQLSSKTQRPSQINQWNLSNTFRATSTRSRNRLLLMDDVDNIGTHN